jgi:hypothetical protein
MLIGDLPTMARRKHVPLKICQIKFAHITIGNYIKKYFGLLSLLGSSILPYSYKAIYYIIANTQNYSIFFFAINLSQKHDYCCYDIIFSTMLYV